MKLVWITGTSRGLGKALAHQFLMNGWQVYGIGRAHTIDDDAYHAVYLDLADPQAVLAYRFSIPHNPTQVLFIHNAGILGEIAHIGNGKNPKRINETFQVNLVSATILSNAFLSERKHSNADFGMLFIGSGAGRSAYDGWASYCSSKAGIDMLARCIAAENKEENSFHIFSIAPGVIDTAMQEEIRGANPSQFSKIERFETLKREDKLEQPKNVAAKIYRVWEMRIHLNETCIDLRELVY